MGATALERGRSGLARAVMTRVAGPDYRAHHDRIWDAPGPRWFTQDDEIWRVHADTAMFAGGLRALLLQSLHPVAMLAVSRHSGFRGDPWGRLQRTSHFLATTTYGTIADATAAIDAVNAIHARVRGSTPEGRPYRADDPHLLSWIHLAQVDSFLATHQAFGQRPLDAAEADRYVAQSAVVARLLQVPEPPIDRAGVEAGLAAYRPELRITPEAREAARLLLREPPLPGPARVGYAMLAAGAISVLPPWARAELGLPTLPATDRVLTRPVARAALGTLRWALRAA